MSDKKILDQLHEYEKRILKALEGRESITMDELEVETGLVRDALEKASLWAKVKGVIKTSEEIVEYLELTGEGKEYADDVLPERNLLTTIAKGEARIDELKKKIKRFSVGLIWIRRNGWADVQNGMLSITNKGREAMDKKIPEEMILSALSKGIKPVSQFDEDTVARLERRGLVRRVVERKKEISLTDLGRKIVPQVKIKEEIGQITPKIIKEGEWKKKALRQYDISLPSSKIYPGKRHFMMQVIDYIRKIWIEMGFKEMTGPLVEISFWNFDALYQPQDHPARDLADTFYMKTPQKGSLPNMELVETVKATHENGWTTGSTGWQYKWDSEFARQCILRTHTTSLSARTLACLKEEDLPAKFFAVGRCFRNETLDWKHLAEFYQTEGIVVGGGVTFRNLLAYLKQYFSKMGFPQVRFRPAYFPYTEFSTEVEVFHPDHKEWLELGGAGIFRPEVVKPLLGKNIPVLAWGLTMERIVMKHYGINDIRQLYLNDLKQVREAKLWLK